MMDTPVVDKSANELLQQALDLGLLRQVDVALVTFIQSRHATYLSPLAGLSIAWCSYQTALGNVCIDLHKACDDLLGLFNPQAISYSAQTSQANKTQQTDKNALMDDFIRRMQPLCQSLTPLGWAEALQTCEAIEYIDLTTDQDTIMQPAATSKQALIPDLTPLVLVMYPASYCLYLRRYWQCELGLSRFFLQRSQAYYPLPTGAGDMLQSLFAKINASHTHPTAPEPSSPSTTIDWQMIAVALVATQGVGIITGGPGTGKTTTVLQLLALLQAVRLNAGDAPWCIKLAAPTGKASTRLSASLASNLPALELADLEVADPTMVEKLRASIPTQVSTLHRLLGKRTNSHQFVHDHHHPVKADVVVVDEASMVDLELMYALTQALDSSTRLILIGDKDQLASVAAGSVFGDLCATPKLGYYTETTITKIADLTGITLPPKYKDNAVSAHSQMVARLYKSYRFTQEGVIYRLAKLVNEGIYQDTISTHPMTDIIHLADASDTSAKQMHNNNVAPFQLIHTQHPNAKEVEQILVAGYGDYLRILQQTFGSGGAPDISEQNTWAHRLLSQYSGFQVLVAVHQGDWGVVRINQMITQQLQQAGLLHLSAQHHDQAWYVGRPVMVTHNDYHLDLMNGDLGICVPFFDPATQTTHLRVVFDQGGGEVRWLMPSRLRHVQTAFAITVHKAQGSEFDHTLLVLPDKQSLVLGKALVYTAITRAKQQFTLVYSQEKVLQQALTQQVACASGLAYMLYPSVASYP